MIRERIMLVSGRTMAIAIAHCPGLLLPVEWVTDWMIFMPYSF